MIRCNTNSNQAMQSSAKKKKNAAIRDGDDRGNASNRLASWGRPGTSCMTAYRRGRSPRGETGEGCRAAAPAEEGAPLFPAFSLAARAWSPPPPRTSASQGQIGRRAAGYGGERGSPPRGRHLLLADGGLRFRFGCGLAFSTGQTAGVPAWSGGRCSATPVLMRM